MSKVADDYFGWDLLNPQHDTLVITSTKAGAMALTAAGIENAVTVPGDATDLELREIGGAALNFQKIILAFRNGTAGTKLTEELSRRFGRERCAKVVWPDDCGDPSEVMLKHGEAAVSVLVEMAEPFPIKGLYGADSYLDDLMALYYGGRRKGWSTGWETIDPYMTIREGEVSVVTGVPGSGKSEWVDALCMNMAEMHGWKFALCSFENPPDEHMSKLVEKRTGLPFWTGGIARISEPGIRNAVDWIKERFVFIRAEDESPTQDWIFDRARAAVVRFGINGLVIDPYNEIEHQRPDGMTETEYVSKFMGRLVRFAVNHGLHIWLVAHPAKLHRLRDGSYPVPSLYDISGSANFVNKCYIGVIIHRPNHETRDVDVLVRKVKFKSVGRPGEVTLEYDRMTGRYFDKGSNTLV